MKADLYRGVALVLYQTALLLGIVAMPIALVARRLGLTLSLRRLLESAEGIYRRTERRSHR
ncbi:MAG: hypothetical protein ABEK02_03070 [Haloquadratum sp.]